MSSPKRIRIKIIFPSLRSLSAETIANNDDLLTQILLRLPFKSLLRFKCVSKRWLSLISNPLFYFRLNPSNSPRALLAQRSLVNFEFDFIELDSNHSNPPFNTLNFFNHTSVIEVIQSSNGLLLCGSFCRYSRKQRYYICNPTTKQWKLLPPLTQVGETAGLYLAFDPKKSPYYKVICVHQDDISEPEYRILTYSPEIGQWRASSTATFNLPFDVGFYGGVFWNGSVHWYTDSGPSVRFDVEQEKIEEMPMPPTPDDWYRRRVKYFNESKGHLLLIEIYTPPSTQFNVCEMKREYSGWDVKYRVNLEGVVSAFPGMIRSYLDHYALNYYIFQIQSIIMGESDDEDYMLLHIPALFLKYNFKDGSFKKLCDFDPFCKDASNFVYCNAYEYIESLACV